MTDRKRDPLPKSYQFGDAAPMEVQLQRLYRRYERVRPVIGDTISVPITKHWNVIEHEEH